MVVGRVVVGRLVVDRVVVCWVMLSQPRAHSIMIATHHGGNRGEGCHHHHGIMDPSLKTFLRQRRMSAEGCSEMPAIRLLSVAAKYVRREGRQPCRPDQRGEHAAMSCCHPSGHANEESSSPTSFIPIKHVADQATKVVMASKSRVADRHTKETAWHKRSCLAQKKRP